ncbi:UNC93-like protein 3, partial [Camellia lanceoleosa]
GFSLIWCLNTLDINLCFYSINLYQYVTTMCYVVEFVELEYIWSIGWNLWKCWLVEAFNLVHDGSFSLYRIFASIIWVGEGSVIGNFNGEFWGMFAFVGNHMSLFLLKDGTGGTTSGSGTTLLYIVFICSMTLGTILMCFLQKRDAKGEETSPDSSVSFYSSIYIAEPALGESGVGGAMAVYCAFDAICSLAMGRLTSSLKSITLIVCAGVFIQLIVLLWLLLKYVTSGVLGILYPLLMAAALGIGDGIFNTQLNALLGMLFKHDMYIKDIWPSLFLGRFFVQMHLHLILKCYFSIAVVFFVSPYISLHAVLVVMLVAVCISVGEFLFLTLMVEKAFSCAD